MVSITVIKTKQGVVTGKTEKEARAKVKKKRSSSSSNSTTQQAEITYQTGQPKPDKLKNVPVPQTIVEPVSETVVQHTVNLKTGKRTTTTPTDFRTQIITPSPTIEKIRDKSGQVVGIVDTARGRSEAAPRGQVFKEESLTQVERQRAEQIRTQAQLQSLTIETEAKQKQIQEKYTTVTKKGTLKPKGVLGIGTSASALAYEFETKELEKRRLRKSTEIRVEKSYDDITQVEETSLNGLTVGKEIPLKTYDEIKLRSTFTKAQKEGITSSNRLELQKGLKESGYYYLATKPQEVTMSPQFQKEEKLRRMGGTVSGQLTDLGLKKGAVAGATVLTLGLGGAYTSLALGQTAIAKTTIFKVGGTALKGLYGYSVGKRVLRFSEEVKKKDIVGAVYTSGQLASEYTGLKVMKSLVKPKVKFERPITQQEGDVIRVTRVGKIKYGKDGKLFSGKFTKTIETVASVKDTEIAYRSIIKSNKGKLLSTTEGRLTTTSSDPTNLKLKGYERVDGGKFKKVEFTGDVLQQKGVTKPLFTEGQKRLALVRDRIKLPESTKTLETLDVKGQRLEEGFLNKVTPFKRSYVSTVIKVGAKSSLTVPDVTIEQTNIGKTSTVFEGSQAARITRNVLLTSAGLRAGFVSGVGTTTSTQPKVTGDLTSKAALLIEPTVSTETITPVIFSIKKQEVTQQEKFKTKSKLEEKILTKPKTEQEGKVRPTFKTELIELEKPETKTLLGTTSISRSKQTPVPSQELIQIPEVKKDTKIIQTSIPETDLEVTSSLEIIPEEPVPPPPINPYVFIPKVEFGLQKAKRPKQLKSQPPSYKPSLLGIAKGIKGKSKGSLTGFEVRGVPETIKPKKVKNIRVMSGLELKPVKSEIGAGKFRGIKTMGFQISKVKKKKRFNVKEGKISKFFKNAARIKL